MVSETCLGNSQKETRTMALDQSALLEVLDALKAADVDDRVRQARTTIYQALIEAELTAVIGAGPHERTADRIGAAQRAPAAGAVDHGRGSGVADPEAAGRVVLPQSVGAAPAGRSGPVRGGDGGLPAWRVDPQGRRPGQGARRGHRHLQERGSRICADLDVEVGASGTALADTAFPYVFLDATYCKARVNRRVVSQAVVVATGVPRDGRREVLGFAVGDSRGRRVLDRVPARLKARGLGGVQLVISDAHPGLSRPSPRC